MAVVYNIAGQNRPLHSSITVDLHYLYLVLEINECEMNTSNLEHSWWIEAVSRGCLISWEIWMCVSCTILSLPMLSNLYQIHRQFSYSHPNNYSQLFVKLLLTEIVVQKVWEDIFWKFVNLKKFVEFKCITYKYFKQIGNVFKLLLTPCFRNIKMI